MSLDLVETHQLWSMTMLTVFRSTTSLSSSSMLFKHRLFCGSCTVTAKLAASQRQVCNPHYASLSLQTHAERYFSRLRLQYAIFYSDSLTKMSTHFDIIKIERKCSLGFCNPQLNISTQFGCGPIRKPLQGGALLTSNYWKEWEDSYSDIVWQSESVFLIAS